MASKSDLDYYRSQPDYDEFADYLDTAPITIDENELPKFIPDYSSAIVVDGIPIVNQEKLPKLHGVLLKIYGQTAPITEADINVPFDPATGLSLGFCFIKFPNKDLAQQAVKVTDGLAIDKKHTFKVNAFSDLDVYGKVNENDKPPTLADFHGRPEVASWLTDSLCRDQFAIRYGKETEIYWANGTGEQPSLQYGAEREKKDGKQWCELSVEWSPQGTYFATYHKAGVKLWGGADFLPQGRFMHPSVEEISFSPCERYLITYRLNDYPGISKPNDNIIVWDVRTGQQLTGEQKNKVFSKRSPFEPKFQVQVTISEEKNGKKTERAVRGRVKGTLQENERGDLVYLIEDGNSVVEAPAKTVSATQDPNKLKWSADGNYVARLAPDIISVYELPSMNLLDRRSFNAKDIQDFSWSPRSNLLAYWSPANGNYPAVINILKVPERDEICTRKIVDVIDGKMTWHGDGDYLSVHMTKISGRRRTYILMIFRVKVAGVPVEQVEFTEPILNVSWEPSGDRIAVTSGDARTPQITFYSMVNTSAPPAKATKGKETVTTKNELTLLYTKTGTQCSDLQWSPAGGIVSLAYYPPDGAVFELFDVDSNTVLAKRNHERSTKLYWDPSGRYLASCTITELRNINARGQPDDGINFYTFQGTLLSQFKKEKVFGFSWRPRPKDLLSPEEKKNILKNLKKYEKEFEKKDKSRKLIIQQELQDARHRVCEEFLQWRNRNRSLCAALKPRRVALRDGYDSDDDRNYTIEKKVSSIPFPFVFDPNKFLVL